MFPNSPSRGRNSFPLPHTHPQYQTGSLFGKLPVNLAPELLSPEQLLQAQVNFHKNANLSRMVINGNVFSIPPVSSQPWNYANRSPLITPGSSPSNFQNRKRRSDEGNGYDGKRQKFHSPPQSPTVIRQSVPLRDDLRYSFPGSHALPLLQTPPSPDVNGRISTSADSWLFDHIDTTLPVANDKLSQQILELFQACQQQVCDLKKKDVCRAELQREIQQIFPQSRLYLVGSSLNGFGMRSSDADLCLVINEEPMNQKTEARHILSLLQKHFYTRLSYIERPQLIRAKVPIVKFRDKVSGVEFDLNVNNVVGIRNTFLLRSYAYIENRVRPLVLVVKKWASHHGINDASRGTLSSYSLVLMVLHYLQTLPEPILPSLQKKFPGHLHVDISLREQLVFLCADCYLKDIYIVHYECDMLLSSCCYITAFMFHYLYKVPFKNECFNPTMQLHLVHHAPRNVPQYLSKNQATLGELFLGFLKYFAIEFDWNKKLISIREAKAVPRPDDIEWRNKYICVEEPFDRTNTARAVHEKQKFDLIQEEFMKAWVRMRDNKDLNSILPLRMITRMKNR